MHELGVCESVLKLVLGEAERAGASRVTAVNLVLGEFASIAVDAVEFYWGFVTDGTIAEGSRLTWRHLPAEARCWGCGNVYRPAERDLTCPSCGSVQALLLAGEEFRVESIEVE